MSYEKQNFTDGQKLKAEHLNKMDEALANPPIVVAKFASAEWDSIYITCKTHTADEIKDYLAKGTPVLAHVYDESFNRLITCSCWMDGDVLKVGEIFSDSGWKHDPVEDHDNSFADGDPTNKTIGNELWVEY